MSTLAMGLAGSMAQVLLTAGTPGKRYSLPHAQILMHQGSAGFGGTAADVEIYADQLDRIGTTLIRLIAGAGRRLGILNAATGAVASPGTGFDAVEGGNVVVADGWLYFVNGNTLRRSHPEPRRLTQPHPGGRKGHCHYFASVGTEALALLHRRVLAESCATISPLSLFQADLADQGRHGRASGR